MLLADALELEHFLVESRRLLEILHHYRYVPQLGHGLVPPREIGLHLLARALVDDLAAHRVAHIGAAGWRRAELAAHVVDAFAEHHLDPFDALVQNGHIDGLAGARNADGDFLGVHESTRRVYRQARITPVNADARVRGRCASAARTARRHRRAAP